MKILKLSLLGLLALTQSACTAELIDENAAQDTQSSDVALRGEVVFTARPDMRRCMAPLCGGYWIAAANEPTTLCHDGSRRAACYVAELNLPTGVRFEPGDLLTGALESTHFDTVDRELGTFTARRVFGPALPLTIAPDGTVAGAPLHGVRGIACHEGSCRLHFASLLNRRGAARVRRVQMVGDVSAQLRLAELFDRTMADTHQAIVQGEVVRRGYRHTLFVSNLFTAREAAAPVCLLNVDGDSITAWNFDSTEAAQGLLAQLGETGQLLEGDCASQAMYCATIYAPVSGPIDALGDTCQEAENACRFSEMVAHAAGSDSKAQGTFREGTCLRNPGHEGDFCGGIAGIECADGLRCRLDGDYPDAGGTCVPEGAQQGEFCGGIAGIECADGLQCQLDGAYPDAGGTCIPALLCSSDTHVEYVADSAELCSRIRFRCDSQQPFFNECGCGCCPTSVTVDCEGLNATECVASPQFRAAREELDRNGCTATRLSGAL